MKKFQTVEPRSTHTYKFVLRLVHIIIRGESEHFSTLSKLEPLIFTVTSLLWYV